jgi:hypothetical protein
VFVRSSILRLALTGLCRHPWPRIRLRPTVPSRSGSTKVVHRSDLVPNRAAPEKACFPVRHRPCWSTAPSSTCLPGGACADTFVGPDIDQANKVLGELRAEMDDRYDALLAAGRRKVTQDSGVPPVLLVFDELAYFSATVGDRKQQNEFTTSVRDLVARG